MPTEPAEGRSRHRLIKLPQRLGSNQHPGNRFSALRNIPRAVSPAAVQPAPSAEQGGFSNRSLSTPKLSSLPLFWEAAVPKHCWASEGALSRGEHTAGLKPQVKQSTALKREGREGTQSLLFPKRVISLSLSASFSPKLNVTRGHLH